MYIFHIISLFFHVLFQTSQGKALKPKKMINHDPVLEEIDILKNPKSKQPDENEKNYKIKRDNSFLHSLSKNSEQNIDLKRFRQNITNSDCEFRNLYFSRFLESSPVESMDIQNIPIQGSSSEEINSMILPDGSNTLAGPQYSRENAKQEMEHFSPLSSFTTLLYGESCRDGASYEPSSYIPQEYLSSSNNHFENINFRREIDFPITQNVKEPLDSEKTYTYDAFNEYRGQEIPKETQDGYFFRNLKDFGIAGNYSHEYTENMSELPVSGHKTIPEMLVNSDSLFNSQPTSFQSEITPKDIYRKMHDENKTISGYQATEIQQSSFCILEDSHQNDSTDNSAIPTKKAGGLTAEKSFLGDLKSTIIIMEGLLNKDRHLTIYLLFFKDLIQDDGQKINVFNTGKKISSFYDFWDTKEFKECFFIFCLYSNHPTKKYSAGKTAILMPMIYRDISQYDSNINLNHGPIIKLENYLQINFILYIKETSSIEHHQKFKCRGELHLPDREIYRTSLKTKIFMEHANQKILVHFISIKSKKICFTFFEAKENKELEKDLLKSVFISKYIENYKHMSKRNKRIDVIDRNKYFIDPNTILKSDHSTTGEDISNIYKKVNNISDFISPAGSEINNKQNQIDDLKSYISCSSSIITTIEPKDGPVLPSVEFNRPCIFEAIKSFLRKGLGQYLVVLIISDVSISSVIHLNVLAQVIYLKYFPSSLDPLEKNDMFSLLAMYFMNPKKVGSLGTTAVIVPITYQGVLQHNKSFKVSSKLLIHLDQHFIIYFDIYISRTTRWGFSKKRFYKCELQLPEEKDGQLKKYLKMAFVIEHANQIMLMKLIGIRSEKLCFLLHTMSENQRSNSPFTEYPLISTLNLQKFTHS